MMSSKIRVFGKTHNRTALGIIHAYMLIYPETTLEQMRVIFPDSINPVSNIKEMFVSLTKDSDPSKLEGYFNQKEELLVTGDGKKAALISQWPLESLQRVIEKAKAYGIEVADFEPADEAVGYKGGYYIEFLDNWNPSGTISQILEAMGTIGTASLATNSAKGASAGISSTSSVSSTLPTDSSLDNSSTSNNNSTYSTFKETNTTMETTENTTYDDSKLNWLWVLIGLTVAGLFAWAICNTIQAQKLYANMDGSAILAQIQPGDATVEALPLEVSANQAIEGTEAMDPAQVQAKAASAAAANAEGVEAPQVDPSSYMERFTQLQHQFNGIEYKNANATLSDSAMHVLNQVAALMEEYPSLDLRIEGHTSSVGRANYNLKLSQRRAMAVATYLEGKGIAADRLVAVGMGEAQPVDPANPNGSDNRVTCLFNISHNEARAQKASLADIVAKEVSEEGPITADF